MSTYEHHNGQDYHPANDTRTPWPDYRPAGGFFALACELATMREGDLEKLIQGEVK